MRLIDVVLSRWMHCPSCGQLAVEVRLRQKAASAEVKAEGARTACGCCLSLDAFGALMRQAEREQVIV